MSFVPPLIALPKGLGWSYTLSPKFSTISQVPQSGRHPAQATLQESTIFELELTFDYLQLAGYQYLKEFYEAMRGSYGFFLFDPSQFDLDTLAVTEDITQPSNGFIGQGDGTTKVFAMWRSSSVLGGGTVTQLERIQNITLLTGVFLNGVLQATSSYTQANLPSQITFTTAPAAGANISWAGNYSYLVHFSEDTADFEEFMFQIYKMKSLKLETINL